MASDKQIYTAKRNLGCRDLEIVYRELRAIGDDFRAAELRHSTLSGKLKKFLATYDVNEEYLTFAATVCLCSEYNGSGYSSSSIALNRLLCSCKSSSNSSTRLFKIERENE
jgi:hypothetical protein